MDAQVRRQAAALLRRIAAELAERAAALEADDGVGPVAEAPRLAVGDDDEDEKADA